MNILLDTGPLVALLNRRDEHQTWAVRQAKQFTAPFLTCEAVLSEADHLLGHIPHGKTGLVQLINTGKIDTPFSYRHNLARVNDLLLQFQNVPMSFADACLVRMSELQQRSQVFTIDADFFVYRTKGDKHISVISPEP